MFLERTSKTPTAAIAMQATKTHVGSVIRFVRGILSWNLTSCLCKRYIYVVRDGLTEGVHLIVSSLRCPKTLQTSGSSLFLLAFIHLPVLSLFYASVPVSQPVPLSVPRGHPSRSPRSYGQVTCSNQNYHRPAAIHHPVVPAGYFWPAVAGRAAPFLYSWWRLRVRPYTARSFALLLFLMSPQAEA